MRPHADAEWQLAVIRDDRAFCRKGHWFVLTKCDTHAVPEFHHAAHGDLYTDDRGRTRHQRKQHSRAQRAVSGAIEYLCPILRDVSNDRC